MDLITLLPERFDFYHLGEVEHTRPSGEERLPALPHELNAVAYRFSGDYQGVFIAMIPQGLDISIYSELGNILASRFATAMNRHMGMDVMVSPPSLLGEADLNRLLHSSYLKVQSTYEHRHEGTTVSVEVIILASTQELSGNA